LKNKGGANMLRIWSERTKKLRRDEAGVARAGGGKNV